MTAPTTPRTTRPTALPAIMLALSAMACPTEDPPASSEASTSTDTGDFTGTTSGSTGPSDSTGPGDSTSDSTGSSDSSDSSTGSDDTTTGSDDSTTGSEVGCERCDAALPHCVDGECVPCSEAPDPNASCAATSDEHPICFDGACVACTLEDAGACPVELPVCALPAHACVECTDHTDCPGSACDIAEGTCFAAEQVVEVDADACDPDDVCALDGGPCCSVDEALALPEDELAIIVHGGSNPVGSIALADRRIAIRGAPGGTFAANRISAFGQLEIDGGRLYIAELFASASTTPWIIVSDGLARFDRATIEHLGAASVALDGAGAQAQVVSSVMFPVVATNPAYIDADGGATVDVRYSTIVLSAGTTAVTCTLGNTVTLRNDLILSNSDLPVTLCPSAEVTYSATSYNIDGDGNQTIGPYSSTWVEASMFDYHLTDQHPMLIGVTAQWTEGDPLVDLDGEARMVGQGVLGYAGADRP